MRIDQKEAGWQAESPMLHVSQGLFSVQSVEMRLFKVDQYHRDVPTFSCLIPAKTRTEAARLSDRIFSGIISGIINAYPTHSSIFNDYKYDTKIEIVKIRKSKFRPEKCYSQVHEHIIDAIMSAEETGTKIKLTYQELQCGLDTTLGKLIIEGKIEDAQVAALTMRLSKDGIFRIIAWNGGRDITSTTTEMIPLWSFMFAWFFAARAPMNRDNWLTSTMKISPSATMRAAQSAKYIRAWEELRARLAQCGVGARAEGI